MGSYQASLPNIARYGNLRIQTSQAKRRFLPAHSVPERVDVPNLELDGKTIIIACDIGEANP
ncbi:MAG: hypothetical protein ACTSYT_02585, partial [Candidatus Asgardarchaeia archaeon]